MQLTARTFWQAALCGLAMVATVVLIVGMTQREPQSTRRIAPPPAPTSTSVRLEDAVNYFQGPYIAYAGDWSVRMGRNALRHGVDYRDTIFVEPESFPAKTEIHWVWPRQPPQAGVYGFMHIAYGYYAGGTPEQEIPARRIKDIDVLKTRYAVATARSEGQHNILSETFLTRNRRDFASRSFEIGFLTHLSQSGREFFDLARSLGTWTDPDGRVWRVAIQDSYCMFVPAEGPLDRATLHYDEAFRWLVSTGELTGDEWFNGLAIGVEPVSGSGSAVIDDWQVEYR